MTKKNTGFARVILTRASHNLAEIVENPLPAVDLCEKAVLRLWRGAAVATMVVGVDYKTGSRQGLGKTSIASRMLGEAVADDHGPAKRLRILIRTPNMEVNVNAIRRAE